MLSVKNLTVAYDDTPVFTDVAVQFDAGKITGIIGPNGAGKSTLIKAILGLVKARQGSVLYQDRPMRAVQKQVAYVEQRKDLDLNFPINVFDVVLTGTYGKLGLFRDPGKKAPNWPVVRWTITASFRCTRHRPRSGYYYFR